MLTLRHAAELLAATSSLDALAAAVAPLGFTGPALPLDAEAREQLGLSLTLREVRVVRGRGALRAMLILASPDAALRGQLTEIAAALARRSRGVLWTIAACAGDESAIACWEGDRMPPRIVALVVNRRRIVSSDADSLVALAAASEGDDLLVHTRWCELLGREALTRRFYRALEQRVTALARSLVRVPAEEAAELALLTVSRLVFLCFLQAKGWLNGERGFLSARYDECMGAGGSFHRRVLLPLFFGTLNTPIRQRAPRARAFGAVPFLNGGLFTRTALERRHPAARFPDDAFGQLFAQLLDAYRFTAREDDERWSEVAIDPEMLGRAFESLMAARDRRTTGAFYTPQPLVTLVADTALAVALSDEALPAAAVRSALHGLPMDRDCAEVLRERLLGFTVLDPACGSGAFLVHLLERLTALHQAAGDTRQVAVIRREVLARSLHGVDVNPTAVWLCELRLWLCVVIESDETRMGAVTPLPNLDCNVRVGDSLSGDGFAAPPSVAGPSAALLRLHERYVRAAGARKAPLRRALAREERMRALAALERELRALAGVRRERVLARRSRDLFGERRGSGAGDAEETRRLRRQAAALRRERRRIGEGGALAFSFASHFGHVHVRGGFGLVVGNPPWVRLHNIPPAARVRLRERFEIYRDPGWQPAPLDAGPKPGFGPQVDLAALFVERSVALAAAGGTVALLLPAKLWRSLSGGGVRRLLSSRTEIRHLGDWTDAPSSFDAAVYPSFIVTRRASATDGSAPMAVSVRRRTVDHSWQGKAGEQQYSADRSSPWLLLPPEVRAAFDRLAAAGPTIGSGALGRATLGVKSGCNDAFMLQVSYDLGDASASDETLSVEHLGRRGQVERGVLRPLLRGDALAPWVVPASRRAILWTHAPGGAPLDVLPAGAARWLAPWRRRLASRSDLHGARAWWMLFRTEGADASRPRVVWSDFGRAPRAALLAAGEPTVPLNSCYVLPCDDERDALALTALLNSPVAAAWLNVLAEPARGGWHRYLAWTVSLLPLPRDWARARALLAPLAERAILGVAPSPLELTAATCDAYRVAASAMEPLLGWSR